MTPGWGRRRTVRPGGLAAQPFGVVPRRDEQQCRGVGADPAEGEQLGGVRCHERNNELVEPIELAVEELSPPSQLTQCDAGGVADGAAGAGPQRRSPGHQGSRGVPCEPGPQVIRPGQHQCPGLVDGLGAFSGGAAFGDHERPDRLDGPVPALRCPRARPDWAARAALTASSGSDLPCRRRSWRSERSTSTTRTPAAVTWRARPAP